jgi:hypothetical protein
MIHPRLLQWCVVPLWVVAWAIHHTVVPFPPWASRTSGVALFVLLLTYGLGALLGIASAVAPVRRFSGVLHRGARMVFLLGGCAVWCLQGRPDQLASAWALFLVGGRLRPPASQADESP